MTVYAYDALGRLLTYGPDDEDQHQSYAWDALPDRRSITKGSGPTQSVSYDAASRPVADSSHASDGQGRVTQTPGSHANEVLTLSWNPIGRLTAVSSSLGGSTAYTYDPLDRLATISSGGTTTSFLYVGLTDALARTVTTTASTSTTTQYVSDLDGTVLFEYDATTLDPIFLGRNAHGDVTWSYGSDGAPIGHATYDPFANVLGTASVPAGIRWQSSWEDATTGLYYVVARWYDPVSGRFLSEDPMEQAVERPQDRDPYAYGAGDQVNKTDPDGRCTWEDHYTGCPYRVFLDTSVVRNFDEPRYGNNFFICGAGALRVVLAFASHNPKLKMSGSTRMWDGKPESAYGWLYMLYLAHTVRVPNMSGAGTLTGDKPANYSNPPERVMAIANWEYWGASSATYKKGGPFVFYKRLSEADFRRIVEAMIYVQHVPVLVGLTTAYGKVALPEWAGRPTPIGHYVTIVGFDDTNYYIVDTCNGSCRSSSKLHWTGPSWDAKRYGVPGRPDLLKLWAVPKHTLWVLENKWSTGFMRYWGPPLSLTSGI